MSYEHICSIVRTLRKQNDFRDVFELADKLGILLIPRPMGTAPNCIKGFYMDALRVSSITYNSDLPRIIQTIIVAHEIGHFVLHRRNGMRAFHGVTLFDETSIMEKEANLFAAELLLDDDEVVEKLNEDLTFFEAAAVFGVPAELLDFKFRLMKWKGYKLSQSPIVAGSNFLRGIEIGQDYQY